MNIRLAKGAENADLDSLWVSERLIWPIEPLSPYPGTIEGNFQLVGSIYFEPVGCTNKKLHMSQLSDS